MRTKITQTLINIRKVIFAYPLFLVCAFILMVSVQALIGSFYQDSFKLVKLAFTAGLGVSLSFGVALLGQRTNKKGLWTLLVLAFLFAFYFLVLPEKEKDFNEHYAYILIPSYILSHLFVSVAPFLAREKNEQNFWEYNKTLFINFFLTTVFTGVLCGGVQLALLSMDQLFGMELDFKIYSHLFFGLLILGSAIIFALFHVEGLEKMEMPRPFPSTIAFFTQFILIPLLLLYAGILYLYGFKITWTWELPKGWISYLVLIYGTLGILALLLVHPLLEGKPKAWVAWFRKLFYYTLVPLLVLLFVAISTRINEYGFTEPRYFVLLLSLWLTFVTFYFIFFTNPTIRTIPYSLLIAGVLALIIPYANVYAVSKRSQTQAFVTLLKDNNLLENGKISVSQPVSNAVVRNLQSKYSYLYDRNAEDGLITILDEESRDKLKGSSSNIRSIFEVIDTDNNSKVSMEISNKNPVREIEAYSYSVNIEPYSNNFKFSIQSDSIVINQIMYGENNEFTISINESVKDLMPLLDSLVEPYFQKHDELALDDLSLHFKHAGYSCKVLIDQISVNKIDKKNSYYLKNSTFLFRKEQ